jgi:hypothetical protein
VAAFYRWLPWLFYRFTAPVLRDRFLIFIPPHRVCSEVEKIVNWMAEILFAAEIA